MLLDCLRKGTQCEIKDLSNIPSLNRVKIYISMQNFFGLFYPRIFITRNILLLRSMMLEQIINGLVYFKALLTF